MKTHRFAIAIALLALALAACATPESPASTDAPMAKRPAGQENVPLLAWRAFGTEPFWNVRVDGDTLVFTTPDDQSGRMFTGTYMLQPNGGMHYEGKDGDTAFMLDIAKGECSDGMSDNVYGMTAEFRYGDVDYKGCAEAAK